MLSERIGPLPLWLWVVVALVVVYIVNARRKAQQATQPGQVIPLFGFAARGTDERQVGFNARNSNRQGFG